MAVSSLTTLGALRAASHAPSGDRELNRGKPVALLAFLAASPGRRASRERLASLLWSEGSSDQARQNLRQTIWYLKRRLGDWIVATDDFLELIPEVDVDRDRFLIAVREQRLRDAVAAYGGEFVPDFAAPGAADFEHWADIERRRLRGVFVSCCDTLARQSLSAGQFPSAVEVARLARDAAPLDFATWRLLLESLVAARDTVSAVAEAEHLEALAAAEEMPLDDATRSALRSARAMVNGAAAGARQSPGRGVSSVERGATAGTSVRIGGADHAAAELSGFAPELIGREAEFGTLLARWEQARSGRGVALVVTGVAGLGKTRLLLDFQSRLRASRARVVAIRANPGDRAVGGGFLAAVAEALAQRPGAAAISEESASVLVALAPALASVFPRARPDASTGEDALRRRGNAVLDLIRAISDETALALLIDDVHWADQESRRVLDAVTARLDGGRVLLVLAARPPLDALGGFTTLERIELARFDLQRVVEFLTRLGELPAAPWAAELPSQLLATTRGIPLTLIESLARLVEADALTLNDHRWSSDAPAQLVEVLREGMVLEARVRTLTPAARELLLLLAVIGRPTGEPTLPFEGPLAELEHRGFVSRHEGSIAVAHDEIAAAVLAGAADHERIEAHRVAAALLADGPETDVALSLAAQHALAAGEPRHVAAVARRWVARQRARGYAGPGSVLIAELMPDAPADARRRALRALPWWNRPARATVGLAAMLLLAAGLLGGWTALRPPPQYDLELILRSSEVTPTYYRVVVPRLHEWEAGEPVEAERVDVRDLPAPLHLYPKLALWQDPRGDGWHGFAFVADSGGDEVLLVDSEGGVRRPVSYRGDDNGPERSPDGRLLAFSSARWHPETDLYNIGIWDAQTDSIRRLVTSADFDAHPRWSPDGSRIAFQRRYFTEMRQTTICLVQVDGSNLRCDWPGLPRGVNPLVWADDEHVLVSSDAVGGLFSLNVTTGAVVALGEGGGATALIDPRVVLIKLSGASGGRRGLALRRSDGVPAARMIHVDGRELDASLALVATRWRPRPVERLRLVVPPEGVPIDQRYSLRAEAVDAEGVGRRVYSLRFRSLDDSVARVEGDRLVPRALGVARIVVTAGGWRTDTAEIRVVPSTASVVLREDWRAGWETRWRGFGDPLPFVAAYGTRTMLLPNGDGKYPSGAYFTEAIETRKGLGLEFEVSTPLNRLQWQSLSLSLTPGGPAANFSGWDHRSGAAPALSAPSCGTTLGPEGAEGRMVLPLSRFGYESLEASVPPRLYDGVWHRVRLQLFPDGRCGLAVDGRPLLLSNTAAQIDSVMSVVVIGHSVGTRVAVGRGEVWTGVKGGVDWTLVEARP